MMRLLPYKFQRQAGRIAAFMMLVLFAAAPNLSAQDCVFDHLADIPLDTQEQAAPGIIMFLLDDSGSMDWSIMMTDAYGDSSGLYHGYGYVFDDPGDIYSYSWPPLCDYNTWGGDGVDRRMQWVTQWSETNKMYYNPNVTYEPWPRWDQLSVTDAPTWSDPLPGTSVHDMDPDNPRSLPTEDAYTLDMNAVFYDFGGGVSTQDIQDAGGVIVDNSDAGDPLDFTSSGSWGTSTNAQDYGADYLYTNASDSSYTATWTASNLDSSETYDVYARWVALDPERSESVAYNITHSGGTHTETVNQEQNGGEWRQLAEGLSFNTGTGVVELDHYVNDNSTHRACADAVAFVPSGGASPINLVRAHYYVQADDGTMYLVNLDGDIEYWEIDDANNNMEVDSPDELDQVTSPPSEIVTGRTYEEERVNFANWYSFYRKRELTAKNAVANVINDVQGVYVGMLTINDQLEQHALPVRVNLDDTLYDETETLLGELYVLNSSGGTPLRTGLEQIGEYYSGNGGGLRPGTISAMPDYISNYMSETSYPYFTEDKGGACEQVFTLAMTDGYWNGGNPYVGNQDADDTDNEFDGDPFADSYDNTLADVAMRYYKEDLNSDLSNVVPNTTQDDATHQHMVTYSVSFGVSGSINRDSYPDCPQGDCPNWPSPWNAEQNKIDDLYHAAINGRGKYINAGDPQELVNAMTALRQDIESRIGSAASVATNSIQRTVGTTLYQGLYHTDNWYGDVVAKEVNLDSGTVGDVKWSANTMLDGQTYDSREILTYDGSSTVPFRYGESGVPYAEDLVNYLRGDVSNNTANGGSYRERSSRLGDVVHSAPEYHDGTVYVGANDGMLHAFDAETGEERFAYVPKILIDQGRLPDLASTDYSHQFYVDNPTYVRNISDSTALLVGGLRKGGKGYFCLDVSDPGAIAEDNATGLVRWEYTAAGDDDLGYSYSRAYIVKTPVDLDGDTNADDWIVVFGNGYDSVNGEAVLYVLNAKTGALLKKFHTQATGCNGLSSPAITDVDVDGYADYVYAGDLLGNLWKFDLGDTDGDGTYEVSDWEIAYEDSSGVPQPLIKVNNASGGQPITVEPDVMRMSCSRTREGYFVLFGTGQYIGMTDYEDTSQQTFYGVWDWQDAFDTLKKQRYLGEFTATDSPPTLSNPPADADSLTLLEQTTTDAGSGWRTFSNNAISYFSPGDPDADTDPDHAGWYFNLVDSRARVIRDPSVRSGSGGDLAIVDFISSVPSESPCEAGGSSWLYRLSACNGGRTYGPQFDTNDDEKVNQSDDASKGGKSFDQMIYTPTSIGDKDYITDSTGNIHEESTSQKPEGMSYWRVIQ